MLGGILQIVGLLALLHWSGKALIAGIDRRKARASAIAARERLYGYSELARARAASNLSEEDALVWFGVGLGTLERVEAGEIEPSDELEHRIERFLQFVGGSLFPLSPAHSRPSATRAGGPTGGGGDASAPSASFAGEMR